MVQAQVAVVVRQALLLELHKMEQMVFQVVAAVLQIVQEVPRFKAVMVEVEL